MKTLIKKSLAVLAFGFITGFSAQANESENPIITPFIETNNAIKEHINFPSLILNINQEEKVNVVFTVNKIGQVNFVLAKTKHEFLKKSIESQFLKLKLNNLKANNAYSIVFNFKTI